MTSTRGSIFAAVLFFLTLPLVCGQVERIIIPAGTPEDKDLNLITSEPDAQKKPAMYQDFLQKYSSNPAAVAYANWQCSRSRNSKTPAG